MTCQELMGLLFLSRDMAHRIHLSTKSFAQHMALNEFYHNIIDLADKFAEAYQGRYGLIGDIPLLSSKKAANITEFLQAQLEAIQAGRYDVCKEEETALQNIIDEIEAQFFSTIYKLKFLA